MAVFAGKNSVVIMDPAGAVYTKVFYTGSEPDRNLRERAYKVGALAKIFAPSKSGDLKKSIYVDQNREASGRFSFGYAVVADTRYAVFVHEGTSPHVYYSYSKKMRFARTNASPGDSALVFTNVIVHPGNEANPFLENALIAMAN